MVAVSIRIFTKISLRILLSFSIVFSDVQENANPSNQGVFAHAFTCSCICFLICIKCLQRNDAKKCTVIYYYHVQKEVLPSKNNKTHVIELLGGGGRGERGGSVVECRTPEREVGGSKPTAAVLCPWARHFTPRKYWLITQEAAAASRHD